MVWLSNLLLLRKSGFQTPYRVARGRWVAKGSEYLFEDDPYSKLTKGHNGVTNLKSSRVIRLAKQGCTNRPFYRVVLSTADHSRDHEIEQLGTYDPMPNYFKEKLCSFNFERIKYHMAMGAHIAKPVRRLLGLSGFLPLDPTLFIFAEGLRRRREIEQLIKERDSKEQLDDDEIDNDETEENHT